MSVNEKKAIFPVCLGKRLMLDQLNDFTDLKTRKLD
jgi:hypothetical protein